MELNQTDKKLLAYLYHNYREPLTKIAKAVKLSREQVEYRINKFERQGLIKKYITIFNYASLGYKEFVIVWFKVKDKRIKNTIEKLKNVISVSECLGEYDLVADFVSRDKKEFTDVFNNFLERNISNITDYSVFITEYSELYPLKSIGSSITELYPFFEQKNETKVSDSDKKILRILEENGREKLIEIAKKTNLSAELLHYRVKQLYKNKIILGTRILFDMEKMGFYFATLRIKLKPYKQMLDKLKQYCKNHKNINALALGISDYNCIIQIFYQKEEELRATINSIKNYLETYIEDLSLLLIEQEGRVKTLP